jgi:4-hydroxybenzoate polyprenyltransferase
MDIYRAMQAVKFAIRELNIFLAFSWRDWSATMIPASVFAVGAVRHTGQHSIPSIASDYLVLLLWLATYAYLFNLTNQIVGIDEDRINKPDRPHFWESDT